MRRREALRSVLRASAMTTGTKTTTTGMWLTGLRAAGQKREGKDRARSVVPAMRMNPRASVSIAPVRSSAALRTNMELMMIGALLLKTVSVSSAVSTPVTSNTPIALNATDRARATRARKR